ncbi:MAG: hypothetical protein ACPHV3_02780 [Vibrio sp.]
MQTQDITQTLTQVLQSLSDEGKTPTVALVKARLPMNVPMPAIITAIKTWQNKKQVPKVEIAAQEKPQLDPAVEQALEAMQQKINQLEARITQLERK